MTSIMALMITVAFKLLSNSLKDVIPGVCFTILYIYTEYSNYTSEVFFLDDYSMSMIIMSSLIMITLMMFIKIKGSMKIILITFMIVVMFFSASSFLMMFIMFESSLLPMMMLITMYGNQPERILAARYMMMYTTLTSIPLFLIIMKLIYMNCIFLSLEQWTVSKTISPFIMLGVLAAFLVKIPMFLTHTWLPKAHVEAPTEGSMILAGIMLKMGVFGVLRMTSMFFYHPMMKDLLITLFVMGSVLSCWISISVDDMKMNVAFSSVGHMNFMMAGLTICKIMSIKCCILIMISHGLCSALLFFLVSMFFYKTNSRSFIISKGSMSQYPILVMIMFIGWVINLSCPPSISFAGEIMCMSSIFSYSVILLPMVLLYIVLNSFFCILSYGIMCHSNTKIQFKSFNNSIMVMIVSFSFISPLLLMFISLEMII